MKRADPAILGVVSFATLVSLGIRLVVVAQSGFPLNDGGLFYTMITDLVSSHLVLPSTTTYNGASIAFAYPPLAFYFYAVAKIATRIPLLELMQYGPAVVSCASIPAFYLLAADVLESRSRATLATLVFALLPRAFEWLIMGGGVTRAFGMLFALLAMRQAFRLFVTRTQEAILPLVVFGSLVVYAHPEAATHTLITGTVFYLWKDRSLRGLLFALLGAFGVIALTSPWWAIVLSRHGWDPFLAAAAAARQDSYNIFVGLVALFRFQFADEAFLSIFSVLGLVGIFVLLSRRQLLLPVWFVAMHVLEPRGGALFMMIPMAMCAGFSLDQVLLPSLRASAKAQAHHAATRAGIHSDWLETLLAGRAVRLFLGFILVYGIAAAYTTSVTIWHEFTLSPADLRAFAWARDSTEPQSRFALVTRALPLRDAVSEWFPALTSRQSLGTVFGSEWKRNASFAGRIERYRALQACAEQGTDCLRAWSEKYGERIDYVYVSTAGGAPLGTLGVALSNSPEYEAVYSGQTMAIFRQR
jgi:hypothetical protein